MELNTFMDLYFILFSSLVEVELHVDTSCGTFLIITRLFILDLVLYDF